MSAVSEKTDEEMQLLRQMVDECNQFPLRSPQKSETMARYVQRFADLGYNYTLNQLKQYYNNCRENRNRPPPPTAE